MSVPGLAGGRWYQVGKSNQTYQGVDSDLIEMELDLRLDLRLVLRMVLGNVLGGDAGTDERGRVA